MTAISETSFQMELGLSVSRLDAAVEFYATLFGLPPVRRLTEFARFEVDDPPLILTLRSGLVEAGGGLNHVGFRVDDSARLIEIQHRLESAGIATQREEGVECCYSRQTKFWVTDPDANLWEIYSLEADLDHAEVGSHDPAESAATPMVWGHRHGEPLPSSIPCEDATVDEIHFDGTLDAAIEDEARAALLREAFRVLASGGSLGVAATLDDSVSVPPIITSLENAGFRGVQIEQLRVGHDPASKPQTALRLSAIKPDAGDARTGYRVVYRGPALEVELENGRRFRRGERRDVDRSTWLLCQSPGFSNSFTCFPV